MRAKHLTFIYLVACLVGLFGATGGMASENRCPAPVAQIVSAEGRVESSPSGSKAWRRARAGNSLCAGHSVRTGRNGRAAIWLTREQTMVRLDISSAVTFNSPSRSRSVFEVIKGAAYLFSRTPKQLDVKTPHINGGIEGTEFLLHVDAATDRSFVQVFEGLVSATGRIADNTVTAANTVYVARGETIAASRVEGPRKLSNTNESDVRLWRGLVDPLEGIQWTLYYPTILTGPSDITRSLESGDVQKAKALIASQSATDETVALGLLIDIVQSRTASQRDRNLVEAQRASTQFPTSEAVSLALGYALQSLGRVEQALTQTERFATTANRTVFTTMRHAELALINGDPKVARKLATQALSANEQAARAQTILGYVALDALALKDAQAAFTKAIDLDSFDPAPRFGLGLTKIRRGNETEGRQDLEYAVTLDPNVSLYRSYLGRSYFEEKRSDKARSQYALAKERDPQDPTPWFYEAIQEFIENQPIKALESLNKSIERNDNRAVYRNKAALSDDMAVRGSVLSGIYRTLGLEEFGIPEASRAVTAAPADHAGHRFLADLYADQPRQDYARASEILQAQLLQLLTLDPVRPQLAETDLTFLGGAGFNGTSFNEYTTAFETNGHRLTVAGLGGNYGTRANEVLFSGLQGKVAYNISQFHYETDGVRDNNDVRHDVVSAFVQGEVSPRVRLQAEFRYRNTNQGDLSQNFEPDDFSTTNRTTIESFSGRIGGRFDLNKSNTLIANFGYRDIGTVVAGSVPSFLDFDIHTGIKGYQLQAQHLFTSSRLRIVSGLDFHEDDLRFTSALDISPVFGGVCPPFVASCLTTSIDNNDRRKISVYSYMDISLMPDTSVTLGVSHDDFNPSIVGFDQIQPKFGIRHQVGDDILLRLAYTQSAGTDPETPLSLQPSQIAGFAQFFDDGISATNEHISSAIDFLGTDLIRAQTQISWRESKIRVSNLAQTTFVLADYELFESSSVLSITPTSSLHGTVNVAYSRVQLGGSFIAPSAPNVPELIETFSLPMKLSYFAPWGTAFTVTGTYVRQDLDIAPFSTITSTSEDFVTFDLDVRHRLAAGRGEISVGIKNIFGANFRYQDLSTLLGDTSNSAFVDETLFTLSGTLRF